jgi:hypothetical protein
MSKTLSELIMKQSLKPRAPVMGNFPITALETPPVEDFKTQYEQIMYEKAFKQLRPNPNDVRKSKSYWEILEEQSSDKISDDVIPVKDIKVRPLGALFAPSSSYPLGEAKRPVKKSGATATVSALYDPAFVAKPKGSRSRSSSISSSDYGSTIYAAPSSLSEYSAAYDFANPNMGSSEIIDNYSSGYGNIASNIAGLVSIPARSRNPSFSSQQSNVSSLAPSNRTITQYDFNAYDPFVAQQFTPGAFQNAYEGEPQEYLPIRPYDPYDSVLQAAASMSSRRSRSSSLASEISHAPFEEDTAEYVQGLKILPEQRNALLTLIDKDALYTGDNPAARNYFSETSELTGLVRSPYESETESLYPSSQYSSSALTTGETGESAVGTSGLNLYGTKQGMTKGSRLDRATNYIYKDDAEIIDLVNSMPTIGEERITKEIIQDLYEQASLDSNIEKGKKAKNKATRDGFIRRLKMLRPSYYGRQPDDVNVIGRYNALLPTEKSKITKELKKPKYKISYRNILPAERLIRFPESKPGESEYFKTIEQQLTKKDIADLLREQLMLKKRANVGTKVGAYEKAVSQKAVEKAATKKGYKEAPAQQALAQQQPVDF